MLCRSPLPAKGVLPVGKAEIPKIPRATNGKPDLTGVWQGGSNRIGTWEEANGGGGTNATTGQITPFAIRGAQEKAPYQPWAADKVWNL